MTSSKDTSAFKLFQLVEEIRITAEEVKLANSVLEANTNEIRKLLSLPENASHDDIIVKIGILISLEGNK